MIAWTEGATVGAGQRTWIAAASIGFWYTEPRRGAKPWWIWEDAIDGTFLVACAVVRAGRPSKRFRSFVGAAMYARFGDAVPSGVVG